MKQKRYLRKPVWRGPSFYKYLFQPLLLLWSKVANWIHQWMSRIRRQRFFKMKSANQQPIRSEWIIRLHLRTCDLCIRVYFGVVNSPVVDEQLGTLFLNQYKRGIFSTERKLVPWNSRLVSRLHPSGHRGNAKTSVCELAEESATDDVEPIPIRGRNRR